MPSIPDGDGTVGSGALASYLRATSKTTEPTINGESICGVDLQFVFVVGVAVVTILPDGTLTRGHTRFVSAGYILMKDLQHHTSPVIVGGETCERTPRRVIIINKIA